MALSLPVPAATIDSALEYFGLNGSNFYFFSGSTVDLFSSDFRTCCGVVAGYIRLCIELESAALTVTMFTLLTGTVAVGVLVLGTLFINLPTRL